MHITAVSTIIDTGEKKDLAFDGPEEMIISLHMNCLAATIATGRGITPGMPRINGDHMEIDLTFMDTNAIYCTINATRHLK